ncbi:uncharacterized protein LOC130758752 [Actinidia eriantha]|uniref:uncharacterized protein LOC130758752 n=1 Tax=Actinidia eriantha TaxID=165200 RepID=UPI00258A32F6|nr:uncharacterized protein LOC130758752 [Actinidia eriantha]
MKILSLNVRGLGMREKRNKVKILVKKQNVDMLLLQETKLKELRPILIKSIWGNAEHEYVHIDADGSAGGIITVWRPDFFKLISSCCSRNFVLISGIILPDFPCTILNVYGPNTVSKRRDVWVSIVNLKGYFPSPWCMGGDFNEVRSISERQGCSNRDRGMADFNNFIDDMEVVDLQLLGRNFTWSSNQEGEKWSRIDRFLLNFVWLDKFNLKQWGLPITISDHCPVLIKLDDRDWGPKPFKFLNVWLSNPNCVKLMEEAWESNTDQGWAAFRIHKKLKSMKASLKVWAQTEFGGIQSKLEEVVRVLHELDIKAEQGAISVSEKSKRNELRAEMWKLSRIVDRIWWQKSRLKWQLQGDKNSKFFHYMVSSRQRRNNINTILVNDEQIEDPKLIKKATFNHFKSLYEEEMVTR